MMSNKNKISDELKDYIDKTFKNNDEIRSYVMKNIEYLYGDRYFKIDLIAKYMEQQNSEGHIKNVIIKLKTMSKWELKYGKQSSDEELQIEGKDLYNFTQAEIENMLYAMKISSIANARFYRNVIITYYDYAKLRSKGNLFLNVDTLLSGDNINKYVSVAKETGRTINRKELDNIVELVKNPRDKAMFELLWLGIMGDEHKEIRHLKKKNIDFDKKTIFVEETGRTIENVPDKVLTILKQAILQDEYYTNNGKEGKTQLRPFFDSDYIFRGIRKNAKGEEPPYLTRNSFVQCFYKLKKFFPDKPYLTARNIYLSGAIYNFDKYLKEKNLPLTREVFNEFVKNFYIEAGSSETMYYDFVRYYNNEKEKAKKKDEGK